MTDLLPYVIPGAAGLLGLLFAPAVDRWLERFDAWVDERLSGRVRRSDCKRNCKRTDDNEVSRGGMSGRSGPRF